MAKVSGKVLVDPEIGEVVFRKSRRSRSVSIRVHPVKGVTVSVPYLVPYAVAELFFRARRSWVIKTMARQKQRIADSPVATASDIENLRRQAKRDLPPRLAELAARYGFIYNRVAIKHNSSNWGSCSTKSNINLNLNIVRLPKILQDYILLHELCHLRHHDHGHAFHLLLEHVLTDNLMNALNQPGESQTDADIAVTKELARKAATSRAKYPLHYVMHNAIKSYRLL